MNALRIVFNASRAFRVTLIALTGLLLVGLLTSATLAGMKPAPSHGLGAALSLIAQKRAAHAQVNAGMGGLRHAANGRMLLDQALLRPGALRKPSATTNAIVPISGAVQTFDVFNPPPAFRPLVGFGSTAALNNDSTNPPVFINNLTPVNMMPVWSQNEQFIIFSSNRTVLGGVQADGRFHLWAISVNGGEAFQITDSRIGPNGSPLPAGGGEFFPALSPSNNALAFTSDAQSPGVQNLYSLQSNSAFSPGAFSFDALVVLSNSRSFVNVSDPTVITSLTIRSADPTVTGGDPATSSQFTGFSQVGRPTFSASEGQIVFAALSATGTNSGHFHLYALNTNTRGFDANSASFPEKLTDGLADDTDPAYSPDGQFIAFASTASTILTNTGTNDNGGTNSPNPNNPNNSQSFTRGAIALRSIFLIGGGGGGAGFGTVVQGGQPGNSTQIPGGRVSVSGTDNFGPAWSNFANPNQFTNPTGNLGYLAFSRSSAITSPHDIVYLQVVQGVNAPNTERLTPESAGNPVVTLNTDDNTGETSSTGNVYDDAYPSWSPFLSIFSITYSSNRTVTYNNPASGVPTEVAASIPDGGQAQNPDGSVSYTVAAGYRGVLISQVLNLDPPTLLRFNADEVVHIQAPGADPVRGTANKLAGAGANRTITMTVRLSDREANIDDTGGPNGGPRVYVQIKDPDSKYQDNQNQEHKVFAKDRRYDVTTGANPQANHPSNDVTSGTMNALLDRYDPNPANNPQSTVAMPISGYGFAEATDFNRLLSQPDLAYVFSLFFPVAGNTTGTQSKKYVYPSYGPKVGNIAVGYVYPRGAHGGMWPPDAALNPDNTYIFIGTDGGGTNPGLPTANNTPATQPVGAQFNIPGGDPRLFIPWGPEFETELINPQFATSNNANAPADPTPLASRFASTVANPGATEGDFVSPFWLAGVDDQGAFSGGIYSGNTDASFLPKSGTQTVTNGRTQTDRPTANFTAGGARRPAEWLQLQRVPAAQQDNAGGVLYTINFTAPTTGSDFYVDVIAYDKAAFPNIPNTGFNGQRSNWRIYDNVGGFSTNLNITNNDILVVSDYALGQKFAATTFGGRNSNLNLVPKLFGTESYLTDIDVSRLPDSVYAGFPIGQPPTDNPITATSKPVPARQTYQFDAAVQPFFFANAQNGLGVGSYLDDVINDRGRSSDGNPNVQSQRYSVWRILSRGPVPQRVLNSYLPNPVAQPAVIDPGATSSAYKNVPAATVLDARRCVIWLSPYTGSVLGDPGALDDPGTVNGVGRNSTTKNLTAFVQAGGRLCLNGQDVGSTLTQGGTLGNAPSANPASPNFLPDVLNATLISTGTTVRALTGSQNRITGNPQFDQAYNGNGSSYLTLGGAFAIGNPNFSPPNDPQYAFPSFNNFFFVFPNYPYQDNLVIGDSDYGDSALSQIPPLLLPTGASLQGQPDTVTAINGAVSAATYGAGGPTALVYHDDPFGLPKGGKAGQLPNGGTGSRVVYAAFGLEALTNDYYADVPPNTDSNDMNFPAFDSRIPPVIPRNPRPAILHNIVDFLRTGQVTGTITQTSGTGQGGGLGIDGVTVYLVSTTGAAPPTRVTFSSTTANGGRFTILGVEPGTYFLSAVKPGFQRAPSNSNTAFTVEGDVTVSGVSLTLTPLPNGSVAGLVKDTAGNAISGATVVLTSQDNSITQRITTPSNIPASVNPKDNYFFQSVPVTNYTALATGPTNPNGKLEYRAPTGTSNSVAPDPPNDQGFAVASSPTVDGVNFTLAPILATISGRVFDTSVGDTVAGGTSTGGATVNLVDSTGKTVLTTTAAADGTYTFTNVPAATTPTTYTLTASKAGFGMAATPVVSVTVYLGDVITGADFGLTPLASISGRIFDNTIGDNDAGGKSAGGATVTLTDSTGKVVTTVSPDPTSADAGNGKYTFSGVPPGTYTITATKVGFAATNNTKTVTVTLGSVLTSPATDIGLTPIPPGSINGTVTDANGIGVAGALVTFVSADGTVTLNATADANGNYTIATVFPGTYNGTATGPLNPNGRPTTTQGTVTVTVASGPAVTTGNFSVTTIPPSLAGTVTDKATGKGLASALVTITDTTTGAVIKTVKTDANGAYSTGPLPPSGKPLSQYTVTITASLVGFATQALPSQTIYNGDALTNQNIALVSAPSGSVSGQVTDASNGAGVSGAVVTITSTDGTQTFTSAPTDANGNYVIPTNGTRTNPSGNYIASVTVPKNANGKPEFSPASTQAITIPPDGTQTVNFVLTEIPASLSGTVLDNQTGKPISGATVTITDSTGKTLGTVKTGADGTYSFSSLPAGQTAASFNVSATVPSGYFPGFVTPAPTLSLGDSLTGQNIGLDEQGIITGLVTDSSTGQPLPNVSLTLTDTKTGATPANLTPSPLITTPGTTVGPDGMTSNYVATFVLTPGDTYAVSASKPNFNPSAVVTVTPSPLMLGQVGRANIQLTSGIGTLGGLVSDATTNAPVGGATITVKSTVAGVTTTIATFTTNSSVSPAPDGKTQGLNYSGQVAQGTYTVTLTFGSRTPITQTVTVVGGQFNRLDFTGANGTPPLYTFPAGLQFLSTPYDYSSLGFDALFGILNTAPTGTPPNGNRTHVAVWDPTVSRYALDPNPPADSLRLGIGYWVFLKNPVPVTIQGATPSSAFVPVALHPDWNQIGVPNIKGVAVSSLMFDNGAGGMISFATAASNQYHVVSPTLYSYDGNAYQPVTQSSVLQPWKAYWIKVFANATIEIPTR